MTVVNALSRLIVTRSEIVTDERAMVTSFYTSAVFRVGARLWWQVSFWYQRNIPALTSPICVNSRNTQRWYQKLVARSGLCAISLNTKYSSTSNRNFRLLIVFCHQLIGRAHFVFCFVTCVHIFVTVHINLLAACLRYVAVCGNSVTPMQWG